MSIAWDVSELRQLAAGLATGAVRTGAAVAAVVRKSASEIERSGKRLAPVATGALRDSISTSFEGDGRSANISAQIGPGVDYAPYVEYGTSDTSPQPFMGPAFAGAEPGFIAGLEKAIGGAFD